MTRNWTDEQLRVITQSNSNLLVAAAAGSGKTAVMVERIIRRVLDEKAPVNIDRIVVVTFTKAAAGQMRERIGSALSGALRQEKDEGRRKRIRTQLALLENAVISTIDSFCSYILRNYFNTIDLDPSFRIGDKSELDLMMADVADEVIENAYARKEKSFTDFVESYLPGKSDRQLSDWIRRLYTFSQSHPYPEKWLEECRSWYRITTEEEFDNSPVTQFLLEHVKNLLLATESEYENVLECLRQPEGIEKYIPVFENDLSIIKRARSAFGYEELRNSLEISFERLPIAPKGSDEAVKEYAQNVRKKLKTQVDKLRNEILSWSVRENLDMIGRMRESVEVFLNLVLDFIRVFDERKRENNILSFSDVEHLALKVLYDGDERSFVAGELASLYEEIYIDEYQDSNMVQEKILSAVSRGSNMFMVGDVKQSIYSFRQADPGIFMGKYNTYIENAPEGNSLILLHKNFRSRANVLYSVNDIFRRIMHKNLGGVEYDEDAMLVPGRIFAGDEEEEQKSPGKTELLVCDMGQISEMLNEGDEEPAKRTLQAEAIACRIKELKNGTPDEPPYRILDDTGRYRPIQYKDIVILLRSANVAGPEYAEVLNNAGIPAACSTSSGFYTAREVAEVLNLLTVIDNPKQDIPLAGVLRSYFCYLTAEELAGIKGLNPKQTLYRCVKLYMEQGDEGNLAQKLRSIMKLIEDYRERASYTPIHELVRSIIYDTGYIVYASSLQGGKRRAANLDLLVDKAAQYEQTSFHGLFGFLRYIEKSGQQDDVGEADVLSENDDVVRIISIHKSKGLEFPVVFVGDMEKQYNFRDSNERFIFHAQYGVATDYVDLQQRIRKKTFLKRAVSESSRINTIGEELRVLYVALTRAVDKLILVGAVKDGEEAIANWRLRNESRAGADYGYVYSSTNYLDLVAPAFLDTGTGRFEYRILKYSDFAEGGGEQGSQKEGQPVTLADRILMSKMRALEADNKETEKLERRFNFVYSHEAAVQLPGKFSVSELKHAKIEENEDEAVQIVQNERHKPVMHLLSEESKASETSSYIEQEDDSVNMGAERGNAYHKVFELFDYRLCPDDSSIAAFIHELMLAGRISKLHEKLVNPRKFTAFLHSPLGQRMKEAALSGKMFREQQFITGFAASSIRPEYAGCDELILIQGIIDCYFEEEDGIVIVDYKTDHVEPDNAEAILTMRYQEQLILYARAVSQITGGHVKECIIYSVSVNREIKLPLPPSVR